jgi:biopolymer transport protein TolR
MAMSAGGKGPRTVLSEINVTPLVDVMLVLLIIFMVAAGVQTVEMDAEREQIFREAEEMIEQAERVRRKTVHHKIEIELPKVSNEPVNLKEVKKLQLQVDDKLSFKLGEVPVLDCLSVSPAMKDHLGVPTAATLDAEEAALAPCLKALGEKLVDNHKLQEDKELYLLASRALDYSKVLRIMAAVRQAGVTKFGLVAEPGLLGEQVRVERTKPEIQ